MKILSQSYGWIALLTGFLMSGSSLSGQCIVINEVYIDAAGPCDGACVPNVAEWLELYNTCPGPVDLSCYVVTDGDWTVTIPSGTFLASNSYFTIGGAAGMAAPDLNWGTCNCANDYGAADLGILTNSGEQLVVFDAAGVWSDGVYWSGGQALPSVNNNTIQVGTCPIRSFTLPATADPRWENIGTNGGSGCTKARAMDGSLTWENRCGVNISYDASNGAILPVDYLSISLKQHKSSVVLSWTTTRERNTSHFIVQRSASEDMGFEDLGTVGASGFSDESNDYSFPDSRPLQGISYYRLIQVDLNGSRQISEILTADFPLHLSMFAQISPNPTLGQFFLDYRCEMNGVFHIYDFSGREVITEKIPNSFGATLRLNFDVSGLAAGLYFYEVRTSDGKLTGKLVVQ